MLLKKLRKVGERHQSQQICYEPLDPAKAIVATSILYLSDMHGMYINYMKAGRELYRLTLDPPAYYGYCKESYCDVCLCGNLLSDTGSILRVHCKKCEGKPPANFSIGYVHQVLHGKFKIDHSWLEYGFAEAIKVLGKVKWSKYYEFRNVR